MKPITKQNIQAIHALLAKFKLMEYKPDIIKDISGGRTIHTNELFEEEAVQWIKTMNGALGKLYGAIDPRKKMVNHIFAMSNEMGWVKKEMRVESLELRVEGLSVEQPKSNYNLKTKNDYSDVHAWVMKYGYLKKPLNDYSYEELPKLVTAFKNVYISWMNSKKKNETT